MKVLYFAWLKEKTGTSQEELDLPEGVSDVEGLMHWLRDRDNGFASAFSKDALIRVAVNHEYVEQDHVLANGDEVAFFPPVTGG
ncbi:MAG: molybdopterin converting factor subunit 1 [Magnetovibrio sp.]|nr:molybdopterin converting factor subunit 1 [Magnetovibrio sp.]